MKKTYWEILILFGALILIVFLALLFNLRDGDHIIYTDQAELPTAPQLTRDDPFYGALEPRVVIVHYSDFACQNCSKMAFILRDIQEQFPEDVTVVWKDFPNESIDSQAAYAAIAANCADKQGQFWPYHDFLMGNQNQLSEELYSQIAQELEMNINKFNRCYKKQQPLEKIQEDYTEGLALQITAAPTIFINGERYTGLISEFDLLMKIRNIIES